MIRIIILSWVILMSLAALAAFGIDKYKAKTNRWRIRERTLFLLALLGGGTGAFLGMRLFHHKTLHRKFALGIPAIMIAQWIGIAFLVYSVHP